LVKKQGGLPSAAVFVAKGLAPRLVALLLAALGLPAKASAQDGPAAAPTEPGLVALATRAAQEGSPSIGQVAHARSQRELGV
jgi:hypothetical protein